MDGKPGASVGVCHLPQRQVLAGRARPERVRGVRVVHRGRARPGLEGKAGVWEDPVHGVLGVREEVQDPGLHRARQPARGGGQGGEDELLGGEPGTVPHRLRVESRSRNSRETAGGRRLASKRDAGGGFRGGAHPDGQGGDEGGCRRRRARGGRASGAREGDYHRRAPRRDGRGQIREGAVEADRRRRRRGGGGGGGAGVEEEHRGVTTRDGCFDKM
mmetsp:Transcript_14252/g.61036  ORF Transcript_14252/g.61036 Transcript_14252/m.61036 type:complete len:217 (-) Transcript_14252:2483-3133(-)